MHFKDKITLTYAHRKINKCKKISKIKIEHLITKKWKFSESIKMKENNSLDCLHLVVARITWIGCMDVEWIGCIELDGQHQ